MYSVANSSSEEEDKKEYLKYTRRFLRKIAFSMRTGACDCVVVECSAPGRNDRKGNFVPGPAARALIERLNEDNHTDDHTTFDVVKLDAADFGAYTTRKRLMFAPKGVRDMLPTPNEKWVGWGEPLGVCRTSNLRLVRGSWRCKKFAGVWPSDPGPTVTTHHVFRYAHSRTADNVTLVPLGAVERAKLMGCRADDPRLRALAKLPPSLARTVTGISFCAQWYLAVLTAAAGVVGGVHFGHGEVQFSGRSEGAAAAEQRRFLARRGAEASAAPSTRAGSGSRAAQTERGRAGGQLRRRAPRRPPRANCKKI